MNSLNRRGHWSYLYSAWLLIWSVLHFIFSKRIGELFQKRFAIGICDSMGGASMYIATPYTCSLRVGVQLCLCGYSGDVPDT